MITATQEAKPDLAAKSNQPYAILECCDNNQSQIKLTNLENPQFPHSTKWNPVFHTSPDFAPLQ